VSEILITDAKPIHIGSITRRLRPDDYAEIAVLYGDVRKAIRAAYRVSSIRRVAFVDREIAALWGVTGSLLAQEAHMWLVTTAAVEKVPLAFFRLARKEIREMLGTRTVLFGSVRVSYEKSVRFMRLLGWKIGEAVPLGTRGEMFYKLEIAE
jgi:hypothetical protein